MRLLTRTNNEIQAKAPIVCIAFLLQNFNVIVIHSFTVFSRPRSLEAWMPTSSRYEKRKVQRSFLSSPGGSDESARYNSNGMPILPNGLQKYSQAPKDGTFTIESIPSGLRKNHSTKAGTWGVIRVTKGSVEYKIHQPTESIHVLANEQPGIIEPTTLHQVSPLSDDVEFFVEFYRFPGTGPVEEKREGYNEKKG